MEALDFSHHNDYAWLIAGVCLMVLEAVGVSGVGLMFAGLGAVVAGMAVHFGLIGSGELVSECIVFLAATSLWSYLLWHPIKKFHTGKRGHYRNIVGDTAYAGSNGIDRKTGGEVTWSGTIMKARLAPGFDAERVEAGSQVEITDVSGATLIVKPAL